MKKIVGIDVSKDGLDVSYREGSQKVSAVFSNDKKGYAKLLACTSDEQVYVMEATGPYYYPVADHLYKVSRKVSVVNPLSAKRFCQTLFQRAKTDKADAAALRKYGETLGLSYWRPAGKGHIDVMQLYGNQRRLIKAGTALSNQLHAYRATGQLDKGPEQIMEAELKGLGEQIKKLEKMLVGKMEGIYPELYADLCSIPGIGPKSALLLMTYCKGFKGFDNYKQVIAYLGLSPRTHRSGSSIKGKGHICKMGTAKVRAVLYMAAKSAIRCNPSCQRLYERLRTKGKPYRVAIIAVVNKLIKQAFAIAKSGIAYQKDFTSRFEQCRTEKPKVGIY